MNCKRKELRAIREERRMTSTVAAYKLGISKDQLTHVESGRRPLSEGLLVKMCKVYAFEREQFEERVKYRSSRKAVAA